LREPGLAVECGRSGLRWGRHRRGAGGARGAIAGGEVRGSAGGAAEKGTRAGDVRAPQLGACASGVRQSTALRAPCVRGGSRRGTRGGRMLEPRRPLLLPPRLRALPPRCCCPPLVQECRDACVMCGCAVWVRGSCMVVRGGWRVWCPGLAAYVCGMAVVSRDECSVRGWGAFFPAVGPLFCACLPGEFGGAACLETAGGVAGRMRRHHRVQTGLSSQSVSVRDARCCGSRVVRAYAGRVRTAGGGGPSSLRRGWCAPPGLAWFRSTARGALRYLRARPRGCGGCAGAARARPRGGGSRAGAAAAWGRRPRGCGGRAGAAAARGAAVAPGRQPRGCGGRAGAAAARGWRPRGGGGIRPEAFMHRSNRLCPAS
jgi:hypothetical protein